MNSESYAYLSVAAISLANPAYANSTEDTDETFIPLVDAEDVKGSASGTAKRRSSSLVDGAVITASLSDTSSIFLV